MQREDRTRVLIITSHYRINGEVALAAGSRLTDYIVEAKQFIAVANAEVTDHSGREILNVPFLNLNRDHVELIIPT